MFTKQLPTGEKVCAIGTTETDQKLRLIEIPRRKVGTKDVRIQIQYAGICHSDLHSSRQEWGKTQMPNVPGHEIVGFVTAVGSQVSKFKVGDIAGVGNFVNSCGSCNECSHDMVQYCVEGVVFTYGSPVNDEVGHTLGGYSEAIVVNEDYVFSIPKNLSLAGVAPLLCAGITVWSPMKHFGVKTGDHVGVLGLGGLGHMAVKLAVALGAKVTVLSHSSKKSDDAYRLGASNFIVTSDTKALSAADRTLDLVIDTVWAPHDLNGISKLLQTDGTIVILGMGKTLEISPTTMVFKRIKVAGSLVGGLKETQEMLDFCGKHNITSDIELVSVNQTEKAWDRMLKSDVKFRFVLDIAGTLNKEAIVAV
ncbi:hypothetical protein HK100_002350 [Physocladia obscura]|uniref:Enoyl reductase (ER) domain-containing protein n=1 Tax=Physocladia obscura TaxID=109957 RepID=A0AAD5XFH5_9FUNG|nr:hypothetical protein HK100_002350 [Physocladia obscura]